jgi:pimeloyl-ACP methyl ester carboxylesterase
MFCTPPRGALAGAEEARLIEKLGPILDTAEGLRIHTPDAEVQAYRWRTPAEPSRGRVLLLHGWTGRALIMALFVKPLRAAGFEVIAVDLPAHGRSTSRILNMPIGARTVQALADAMGDFDAIIAHSFGGPIAALAVEGGSPIRRRLIVPRLVFIAAPHALSILTRDFGDGLGFDERLHRRLADEVSAAAGRPLETINTGDLAAAAGVACLVIHDRDDDQVPFSQAEAIVAAMGGRAQLLATTGLGHRRIVVMPNVIRAAVRFVGDGAP